MFSRDNVNSIPIKKWEDVQGEINKLLDEHKNLDISSIEVCRKTDLLYFCDLPNGACFVLVLRRFPPEDVALHNQN